MDRKKNFGVLAATALMAITALSPAAVMADSQKNKNNWRNGAIGAAAVGVYGLTHHNNTLGVLGAAGAAYSAKRYEDERKNQSKASQNRARYHRRSSSSSYVRGDRKYYTYNGQRYYKNLSTGERVKVN
ncbi:hypothetical protein CCAX7_008690 [Capsulimonas corticalis]|uniref:Uncharacterized protein n=1 Tax=Capsulimonas corticalis TaxID=2219043 RepID=A0A402CU29_9BACT|nr:hypothetical protein [Capsulimonas corticalis]BDI28818.1 hypothetical protein CCAX7_008690 [Capsulimonas corticalis]